MNKMTVEDLVSVVRPPRCPVDVGSDRIWSDVQRRFGNVLPDDLRVFGQTYGSGLFEGGQSVSVLNPFGPDYYQWVCDNVDAYNDMKNSSPRLYPYEAFPSKGGLFPVAGITGGMSLFIVTRATPDDYYVVFDDRNYSIRATPLLDFQDRNLFSFLVDFFLNRIEPEPFFERKVKFIRSS